MKECLKCKKEFQEKKDTAKFCSTSCRVMYNRNRQGKVEKVNNKVVLNQILEAMDEFRGLIKSSNINYAPVTASSYESSNTKVSKTWLDELGQYEGTPEHLPTFQDLLNGMAGLQFSDDKEAYAEKIKKATHLSDKETKLLFTNLWS